MDKTYGCLGEGKFKTVTFESREDDVNLIGGIQIGRNWQHGSRVYGIEGDLSFADGLDYLASIRSKSASLTITGCFTSPAVWHLPALIMMT